MIKHYIMNNLILMKCNCCGQPMVEGTGRTFNGLYHLETLECVNDNCDRPTSVVLSYSKEEEPN
jgi:hypothetical protein